MASPPASPPPMRPMSAILQSGRSSSRMSYISKQGGGGRVSDEDGKTSVKVGMYSINCIVYSVSTVAMG